MPLRALSISDHVVIWLFIWRYANSNTKSFRFDSVGALVFTYDNVVEIGSSFISTQQGAKHKFYPFFLLRKTIFVAVDNFSTDLYRDLFYLYKNTLFPTHPSTSESSYFHLFCNPHKYHRYWWYLLRSSPPPLGPCGRSPLPLRSCPQPRPSILVVRRKIFGNQTGGVVTSGLFMGGSAPRGKTPSRPHLVIGDCISRPLLWHLPQHYHPVHCHPALRHSYAHADGPMVEQVECQV